MDRHAIRALASAVFGPAMGIATLNVESVFASSTNPILAAMHEALTIAMVPGLFPSALMGSLWIGFVVNGILYFFLTWAAGGLLLRLLGKSPEASAPPADPLG
jgi:hypothetical protein